MDDIKGLFDIQPAPYYIDMIHHVPTYENRKPSSAKRHNACLNLLQTEMKIRIDSGVDTMDDRITAFIAHIANEYNSHLRAELQRTIEGFRGHTTIRHLIKSKSNTSRYIPITTASSFQNLDYSIAETILILDQQYQDQLQNRVNTETHELKMDQSSGIAFRSFGLITCHGFPYHCWVVRVSNGDHDESFSAPSFHITKLKGGIDLKTISTLFDGVISLLQDCDMIPTPSGQLLP